MQVGATIKLDKVKELIKNPYVRYAMLLLGAPGIGKSSIVREAGKEVAAERNKIFVEMKIEANPITGKEDIKIDDETGIFEERLLNDKTVKIWKPSSVEELRQKVDENPDKYFIFVDFRLVSVEPADLQGIPHLQDNYYVYKPGIWAYVLSKCQGILFLDEITAVNRDDILAAAFQLVLDKKAGEYSFRNDVKVIAAGNSPDESSVARALPAPLTNRFMIFRVETSSVKDWVKYMYDKYGDNWDTTVAGFLLSTDISNFRQAPEDSETLAQYPTPRTWEELARVLPHIEDESLIHPVACSLVGDSVGSQYVAFRELKKEINVDEILENPDLINELEPDKKMMAFYLMAQRTSKEKNIDKYIEKLARVLEKATFPNDDVINYEYCVFTLVNIPKTNRKKSCQIRSKLITKLTEINKKFWTALADVFALFDR